MSLDSVWEDIGREIFVFTSGNFDKVPDTSGIYAWFYPLRISSRNLEEFIDEIHRIHCYDAGIQGKAVHDSFIDFTWDRIGMQIEKHPKQVKIGKKITEIWEKCISDDALFHQLRKNVMKASIFLPPLYVGKATNLNNRCFQHRQETKENNFHNRYTKYAATVKATAKTIDDLIFACIVTSDLKGGEDSSESYSQLEDLVEEIVKYACRPIYSIK